MTDKQGTLPFGRTLSDQRRGIGRTLCPSGKKTQGNMKPLGTIIGLPKLNTTVEDRLQESAAAILSGEGSEVGYLHSVLCQTSLPYRNPGNDVREWERRQGGASLLVEAGR